MTRSVELVDVRVVAEGLRFPEGPVALPDGAVLVVEMRAGLISRIDPDGTKEAIAQLGGGPNGTALGPDGALYVCNNGAYGSPEARSPSIQRVDLRTGRWDTLYTHSNGSALQSPNDLVFDAAGSMWFTDFLAGRIHRAAPDGSAICCVLDGLDHPNGIGLSPQGDVLYWAQTKTRQVLRRRISPEGGVVESPGCDIIGLLSSGAVDPWSLLVGLPGAEELDSLAVEAGGAVCVGTLVESGITVVSPDGQDVVRYVLPSGIVDRAVTNICFGGADLRTAFLTLSETGRLVSCRWPRPGLRLHFS